MTEAMHQGKDARDSRNGYNGSNTVKCTKRTPNRQLGLIAQRPASMTRAIVLSGHLHV
jgi:hypothetical protein